MKNPKKVQYKNIQKAHLVSKDMSDIITQLQIDPKIRDQLSEIRKNESQWLLRLKTRNGEGVVWMCKGCHKYSDAQQEKIVKTLKKLL